MPSIDVFLCGLLHYPSLNSSAWLLLVCSLIWLLSLCQSVHLSSNFSPPHSFQMSLFSYLSSFITSAHCELVSCFSLALHPPPPATLCTHHFSSLNLTCPACLGFECPTLISSLLLPPSSHYLFTRREMEVALSGRIDGWREAMGEWIWASDCRFLSLGVIQNCLVCYCKKVPWKTRQPHEDASRCSFWSPFRSNIRSMLQPKSLHQPKIKLPLDMYWHFQASSLKEAVCFTTCCPFKKLVPGRWHNYAVSTCDKLSIAALQ